MTRLCEVLIVGGGPAGSSCARRLVEAGVDVLLMDRRQFPRDKTCAGWVTPPVIEVLDIDLDEYAQQRVCQPITGFRTGLIGGKELATNYDRVVSYGIRRCEFDTYLLDRSAVPTVLGESVRELRRRDGGWLVNGEIQASVLVGAGGHFCPVARMLGGQPGQELVTVAAQEIEFPVSQEQTAFIHVRPEVPELYFCPDLAGYGWCFRKGDYLNIGLGRLNSRSVSAHVHQFCEWLRERGKVCCEIPQRFHGHAYRIYERQFPRLVDEAVLLIGDAAGLAYPQSGEGIRPAVESGLLAADVLLEAKGQYSYETLQPYADRVVGRLGTPRASAASNWLPASFLRFAAGQLMANRWFTRHVLLDQWFLHARTPALERPRLKVECGPS